MTAARGRILDDEPTNRRVLAGALDAQGYLQALQAARPAGQAGPRGG